jgi:protein-S-isoprenylcysteine O-methyltransferase Ste14
MDEAARLPIEVAGAAVGVTWLLVGILWAVVVRWEKTGVTEARRRELEEEASSRSHSLRGILVWRIAMNAVLVGLPLLFVVDAFVGGFRILYAPSLSFFVGPDFVLQIAGLVLTVVGLVILIAVGRKLAVNVYRRAVPERRMMTMGVHRYVRHPFYIHFFLVPVGSLLISLNYLALLLLIAYTMQWEPRFITSWMLEEEEDLRRHFGPEGEAYLDRTGRVLPRLRRRRG